MTRLPTVRDSREAEDIGRLIGPDRLRDRASLVVRCDDCGGQFILAVAYICGRALMASRGAGGHKPREHRGWGFRWLDLGGHVQTRCRHGEPYVWTTAELLALVPAQGKPRAEHRVSHRR